MYIFVCLVIEILIYLLIHFLLYIPTHPCTYASVCVLVNASVTSLLHNQFLFTSPKLELAFSHYMHDVHIMRE